MVVNPATSPPPAANGRGRLFRPAAIAAGVIAVLAGLVLLIRPAGAPDPETAALESAGPHAEAESLAVLRRHEWGDGWLVMLGFDGLDGERRLGLAFAIDRSRGWVTAGFTHSEAALDDVVVGSLLVASSEGGPGQPPWSAACGELTEDRIEAVEVVWADGETTLVDRVADTYLAVRSGVATPEAVRYLADDGTEIAVVPVGQADVSEEE